MQCKFFSITLRYFLKFIQKVLFMILRFEVKRTFFYDSTFFGKEKDVEERASSKTLEAASV